MANRHSPWRRRAGAWRALGLREKAELVVVAGMAALAEIAVKAVSLPRLTRLLGIALVDHDGRETGIRAARRTARGIDADEIARRARAVDRVYRAWPRKSSCLRRALVLGRRIHKADPVLLIGVANEGESIRAHAWIEVDGVVVGEDTGEFAPLRTHKNGG